MTTTAQYSITDLGTLGGTTSLVSAINEIGHVVGVSALPKDVGHAFLWQDGLMTDLGVEGSATDINDLGQIVGFSGPAVFLWEEGTMSPLPDLGGGAYAFELNNLGEVAGFANEFDPDLQMWVNHAALWQNGSLSDLGTFGGVSARATAINDFGAIAISAYISPTTHALLLENGIVTNLGSLGYEFSQPEAINHNSQIVGSSSTATHLPHAFLWQAGSMIDLGTLGGSASYAYDINDAGQVVGMAQTPVATYQAFFWEDDNKNGQSDPGEMHDLNDLIPPDSGWDLTTALGINEAGQIVGRGVHNGQTRAFLLDPPRWTVMFYLDGDNDLNNTYAPILNRLEVGANNPNANVLALWDNTPNLDTAYIEVQYDANLSQLFSYNEGVNSWSQGELAMNDPATLSNFIAWAVENYPAQHYALVLDDHGSGLSGGLCDGSGTETCPALMDLVDMKQALADAYAQTGEKIDVLYMAMCLMGMLEDGYQFRDYADYYVANETIQLAFKAPYTGYVQNIQADSTPAQVATLFASAYADVAYEAPYPYTISAVDLTQISTVVTATNALAAALDANLESITTTLALVVQDVQRFDQDGSDELTVNDTYLDLYHFATLVEAYINEPDIIAAAQQVQQALLNYVIYESHGSDPDVNLSNSHGVSIFFPGMSSSFYDPASYDFAAGANWGGGLLTPTQGTTTWAGMMGHYFQLTQPGGPDDPTPPEPISKSIPLEWIFLPVIIR